MATITETSDAQASAGTTYSITYGDQFLGGLEVGGDHDWIRTQLDVGYSYWVQMRGDGTATQMTDNSLRLRDEFGGTFGTASGNSPILNTTPTVDGTYYIDAGGRYSTTVGTYSIALNREIANSVATVEALDVNASTTSVIDYGSDSDFFRIQLEGGKGYYARMSGDGEAGQLTSNRLRLLDDASTSIESVSGVTPLVGFSPVTDGTYYLQAAGRYTSDVGSYKLELISEIGSGVGTSSSIGYGEDDAPVVSAVDYASETDWFRTELVAGYSYWATVTGDGSGGTLEDARLTWRDTAGSHISVDAGQIATASATPIESGTYYVVVGGRYSSNVGGYEVSVKQEISDGFDTVTYLTPGQTQSAELELNSDVDMFRTMLSGGVAYEISLLGGETGNPISVANLEIFNSNGVQIGSLNSSNSGELKVDFTPDATGTYFLGIGRDSESTGQAGDYDLLLTKTPVSGTDSANTMKGDAEPDVLNGLAGRDFITGEGGADHLNGGDNGDYLFGDQFEANHFANTGAFVYRLYQGAFDRVADQAGLYGWTERLARDEVSNMSAINSFVQSAEFQSTYGSLSNRDFVSLMYQNIFDREADASGRSVWEYALNNEMASRAYMLSSLINSDEFFAAKQADALLYLRNADPAEWVDEVFRLYNTTLGRDPDKAGLLGWSELLSEGTSLETVIEGFTNSPEFRQTYGDLDNSAFVELLYQNVLNRASDTAGSEGWLDVLDGGASRAQVVRGFSQSPEFIAASEAPLTRWMRAQGTDDVLDGGDFVNGADVLVGGVLSDTFIIRPNTHKTFIGDLEPWDILDFSAYGFTDKQQVMDGILSSQEIAEASGDYWSDSYDNHLNFRDPNGNTMVEFTGVYEGEIIYYMIQI